MGQIANQMVLELFVKMIDRLKGKEREEKTERKTGDESSKRKSV